MRQIKKLRFIIAIFSIILLCSCANPNNPQDPYESFNRPVYSINHTIDRFILRPVAEVYDLVVPSFVQGMVTHFFKNVGIITTIPNDLLQGKVTFAMSDFWRLLVNSTVGLGGLFDPADKLGLPEHYEDFGLTLATWGAKDSYYLTLPLFGPSTFRDSFGNIFDLAASPWPYIKPEWLNFTLYGIDIVSMRAELLPADKLISDSFDPYVFVRDAYMQHRQHLIEENKLSYIDYQKQALENDTSNGHHVSSNPEAKTDALFEP